MSAVEVPERSGSIIIPAREELARISDPAARLLACVEPATNALIRATSFLEVEEIRAQAGAIERYARTVRMSTEAIGAAQTIARRSEVRMGQLLGPKKPKGRPAHASKPQPQDKQEKEPPQEITAAAVISQQRQSDLRAMAEHAATVEAVLGDKAPNGQASRNAVLAAIKHESLNDTPTSREGEQAANQAKVPKHLLALERAIKALINLLQEPGISLDDCDCSGPVMRIQRLLPALEEAIR